MDSRSLVSILGILRHLKETGNGISAYAVLRITLNLEDDASAYRACASIVELTFVAASVIENSHLDDEAKSGLLHTVGSVRSAFSVGGLQTQWQSHIGDVNSSISGLVILLSALGGEPRPEAPPDALDLAQEIEALYERLDEFGLESATKTIVLRHLKILATLLRHIPTFGMNAAIITYVELMMAMTKEVDGTPGADNSAKKEFWATLSLWRDRLTAIDELWGVGAKLLRSPPMQALIAVSKTYIGN